MLNLLISLKGINYNDKRSFNYLRTHSILFDYQDTDHRPFIRFFYTTEKEKLRKDVTIINKIIEEIINPEIIKYKLALNMQNKLLDYYNSAHTNIKDLNKKIKKILKKIKKILKKTKIVIYKLI